MKKIKELDIDFELSEFTLEEVGKKVNEIIQVINSLHCVEKESPIYELLGDGDCFIISKDSEGLLVACNIGGKVELERISPSWGEAEQGKGEIKQGIEEIVDKISAKRKAEEFEE